MNRENGIKISKKPDAQPNPSLSTKEKIMAVAARHFSDLGFEGARMDQIAREAGVNKASIYYNIGNKDILYTAVLNDAFGEGLIALQGILDADMTAEKKLDQYVRHLANKMITNPILPKIILREQVSQGKHLPESFVNKIVKMLDGLGRILNQGVVEGSFHKVDTISIHFMIFGAMLFQITSLPIRKEKDAFSKKYKPDSDVLSLPAINNISEYIIRAVKKDQ